MTKEALPDETYKNHTGTFRIDHGVEEEQVLRVIAYHYHLPDGMFDGLRTYAIRKFHDWPVLVMKEGVKPKFPVEALLAYMTDRTMGWLLWWDGERVRPHFVGTLD